MSYISRKMALSGASLCDEVRASGQYKWVGGKCLNTQTGQYYSGDQSKSNCSCLTKSGWDNLLDWGKTQAEVYIQGKSGGNYVGQPSSSFTGSGLIVPAVAVVGGVALLLILKKKK